MALPEHLPRVNLASAAGDLSHLCERPDLGVAQNETAWVTKPQVLVHVSTYQGKPLRVPVYRFFEPQPSPPVAFFSFSLAASQGKAA